MSGLRKALNARPVRASDVDDALCRLQPIHRGFHLLREQLAQEEERGTDVGDTLFILDACVARVNEAEAEFGALVARMQNAERAS